MDTVVDNVFEALFALTDLRMLLREPAPLYEFNEEERMQAHDALNRAKKALTRLEEELGP